MSLTVREHDDLWRRLFSIIPDEARSISNSLRRANGITIIKELHSIGAMNDDAYVKCLEKLLQNEGFTID